MLQNNSLHFLHALPTRIPMTGRRWVISALIPWPEATLLFPATQLNESPKVKQHIIPARLQLCSVSVLFRLA
jgi:hypothetical protein